MARSPVPLAPDVRARLAKRWAFPRAHLAPSRLPAELPSPSFCRYAAFVVARNSGEGLVKTYVLCTVDSNETIFVCSPNPRMPVFHFDRYQALKFSSPQEALEHRSFMDHQLGGKEQYRVHEVMPDGSLVDVES
jgi:hypothetical protein